MTGPAGLKTSGHELTKTLSGLFVDFRELSLLIIVVVIALATFVANPAFLSISNLQSIFLDSVLLVILGIGEMMVILTGNIDLSPSSILAVSGCMAAFIYQGAPHASLAAIVIACLATGAAVGALNGLVVGYGHVPAFIATLGMSFIMRGIAYFLVGGTWIGEEVLGVPFLALSRIHYLVIYTIGIAAVFFYFLRFTRPGRKIYALGSNKSAAEMIGIRSSRVLLYVFTLAGVLAAFGGIIWSSRYGVAQSDMALGFELNIIIVVIIGGTSITGGRGNLQGVILGTLLLSVLTSSFNVLGVSQFWKISIQGLLILIALAVDSFIAERTKKKLW